MWNPDKTGITSTHTTHAFACRALVCLGLGLGVASTGCLAQQKRLPDSLPSIFSGQSVHTTAPTKLVAGATLAQDTTAAIISPSTRVSSASELKSLGGGCTTESVICYDYKNRSARLPIAKELMPEVPGLKKESLSLKRDKLSLNYSF